jgi:pimeloyl-ACP methyl ester carboxylesterase
VLIHGYAENSDSWAPLAADLMKDHTVVVPDLRGIGRSSKPEGGYDKKTQAKDICGRTRHRQHGGLCLCRDVPG